MARIDHRLQGNVEGAFFVDDSCIDCDLCRQIAPDTFTFGEGGLSVAHHQPVDPAGRLRAEMALVSCPTGSIGSLSRIDSRAISEAYPEAIDDGVYFCGYASRDSFGGASYLIRRPGGNVLVDSPRFARLLVKRLEELGGVRLMFLTHRDDVADHERFQRHFGCERIIHAEEDGRVGAERLLRGEDPVFVDPDLQAIPTPGHTKGHTVLLYRNRFLFSGDHLAWSPRYQHLVAFRRHNWYSWPETIRSMQLLAGYTFEWILPGHGRRAFYPAARMQREVLSCVTWMKSVA